MEENNCNCNPEPPAGLNFSTISPMNLIFDVKSIGGYTVIESPPAQESYTRTRKQKRTQLHRLSNHTFLGQAMTERRIRIFANSGYAEELRMLLESAGNVSSLINKGDKKKRTALHFAASSGYDEIVQLLLQYGANPNVQDFNGNTPLHLAACTHHIRVITLLLRYGADVKATDSFGKTPLHLSLSRLKMLQSRRPARDSYEAERRKSEVGEIVAMLKEYFHKSGQQEYHMKMCEIKNQLSTVRTEEEVDEVNSLLTNFTQMTIDSAKKSRMSEE